MPTVERLSVESDAAAELRGVAQRLLRAQYPYDFERSEGDTAQLVQQLWKEIASSGWLSLDEAGSDWLEFAALLCEELGYAACAIPLMDGLVARQLVAASSGGAELGEAVVAMALGALGGDADAGGFTLNADGTVSGSTRYVERGGVATHVLAPIGDRWAMVALTDTTVRETPGLARPNWCDVTAASAPSTMFSSTVSFATALQWLRLGATARAHGSARRAFDLAIEHAKTREQFGGPIGRFQAVQHRLADSAIMLDANGLLLKHAVRAYARGEDEWFSLAGCAIRRVTDTARKLVRASHRTLAGVGFFEEHEAPAHFRRVHADTLRWGLARAAAVEQGRSLLGDGLPESDPLQVDADFRAEIRSFATEYLAEHGPARYGHIADLDVSRRLGGRGLIGLSWDPADGGRGQSLRHQLAVLEELEFAGVPVDGHVVGEWLFGPVLLAHGSEAQKKTWLPRVLAGDLQVCVGYSEPGAGSDLSAIRSTAVQAEDGSWIINGNKVFTSFGDTGDLCMFAARTGSPDNPRKGISLFLVPMKSPGVTVHRKVSFGGHPACTVFYDDVKVGPEALLGTVNEAWGLILGSFTHERLVMGSYVSDLRRAFRDLCTELPESSRDDPGALHELASLAADIIAAGLLVTRCVEDIENGHPDPAHSSMAKAFTGDLGERFAETASELLGPSALLNAESSGPGTGQFEWWQRDSLLNVVAGGTGDIQRNAIAARGLRMPK